MLTQQNNQLYRVINFKDLQELTKETVDDTKEAAHGANYRRYHLVAPAGVTAGIQSLGAQFLVRRQQHRLQGGCHGNGGQKKRS